MYKELIILIVAVIIVVNATISLGRHHINFHNFVEEKISVEQFVEVVKYDEGRLFNIESLPPLLKSSFSSINEGDRFIFKDGYYDRVGRMSGSKLLLLQLPININIASVSDLQAISGIGPDMAERIVERRDRFGKYESVDNLLSVHGIAKKRLNEMRQHLIAIDEI